MAKKPSMRFSGHETFPFRLGWLAKGVRATLETPTIFSKDDAIIRLGVGKNMVRSIRHWCLAFQLIHEIGSGAYEPTEWGRYLFDPETGVDPFLENAGTLWWLHWRIARHEARATTWYYAFNLLTRGELTKESLHQELVQYISKRNERIPSHSSLQRDIECMIRSYWVPRRQFSEETIECPLVDLNLIQGSGDRYRLNRGPQHTLSNLIFTAALVEFLGDPEGEQRRTLPAEHILYNPRSPGRVFLLTENNTIERLEQLSAVTAGALTYDATAGLRQVLVRRQVKPNALLNEYYRRRTDDSLPSGL